MHDTTQRLLSVLADLDEDQHLGAYQIDAGTFPTASLEAAILAWRAAGRPDTAPSPSFTDTPPPTDAQTPRAERVIRAVRAEMARAEALHGPLDRQHGQAIPFRPAGRLARAAVDLEWWARHDLESPQRATTFAILAEEVGELARATPSEAYQEAIQVAAVALRMAVVVAP